MSKAKAQKRILEERECIKGGLIGEIPDNKLFRGKLPSSLTQRSKDVLSYLAFPNVDNFIHSKVNIQGSYNYVIYPYYSDIDSINYVTFNANKNESIKFICDFIRKTAEKLKSNKLGFLFSDLKSGSYPSGESIHWKIDEIIAGVTKDGYTLENAVKEKKYCKIDVIVPYYGRYIEISMIYIWRCRSGFIGKIPLSKDEFKVEIYQGYLDNMKIGNYYKAIKRLYSYLRLNDDVKTTKIIEPLLISNLGKLSTIKSDLATILLIYENGDKPTLNYLNIEFNKIKEMISTILDVPINYKVFNKTLDDLYITLRKGDLTEIYNSLNFIINSVTKQLNTETYKYIKAKNLQLPN